ncbi:hypothetical protein [Spirosoma luteum]|uniref:hypothetical protein n=1 Tax=Spirosoma luteum TaxID=431553 RepID=UPI00039EB913|nr:hypothetical protein [Spirosoma luteum]
MSLCQKFPFTSLSLSLSNRQSGRAVSQVNGKGMESKAKRAGHPAHPILIVFPFGLLASSVIFNGVYLPNDNPDMVLVTVQITGGSPAS